MASIFCWNLQLDAIVEFKKKYAGDVQNVYILYISIPDNLIYLISDFLCLQVHLSLRVG